MTHTDDPPSTHAASLDALFDEAFGRLTAGEALDVDALLAGRPTSERSGLRSAALEALDLARRVAGDRAAVAPELAGYEVLRELGRGAMGTVHLARNTRGELVALKVLPASAGLSTRARARFRAESGALARLSHPGVVAVRDVIESDGALAYAMEWVDGPTLSALLEHRAAGDPAPDYARAWVPFACRAGEDLARALDAAHREGLVHRDVKPSNVLLNDDGRALLTDFGLVRDDEDSLGTETGAFLGTVAYAAPEQLRGEDVDARSDVYGLGVTLYEALAGRRPFLGRSPAEVATAIESGLAPPLHRVAPEVPRALATVVACAMHADPARRYPTAAALADDLRCVLELRPIEARAPGALERSRGWLRRHAATAGAALLATVLTTLAVVGLAALDARRDRLAARAEQALYAAHLALLDADLDSRIWRATLGAERERTHDAVLAGAHDAARHYARALELARASGRPPFDLDQVEREATVVDVALALGRRAPEVGRGPEVGDAPRGGGAPDVGTARRAAPALDAVLQRLASRAPRSAEVARAWSEGRSPDLGLDSFAPGERRTLGLLAALTLDLPLALQAWWADASVRGASTNEHSALEDPLVDGLVGHALLVRGEAARAYPRLLRATERFDDAGALHATAALAAIACGDLDVAARLAEEAGDAGRPADARLLARVAADLTWARGRPSDAYDLYEPLIPHHIAVAQRLTEWREAQLRSEFATSMYLGRITGQPELVGAHRGLLRSADDWWSSHSLVDRRTLLARGLDGEAFLFGSLPRLFAALESSAEKLRAHSGASDAPAIFVAGVDPFDRRWGRDPHGIVRVAREITGLGIPEAGWDLVDAPTRELVAECTVREEGPDSALDLRVALAAAVARSVARRAWEFEPGKSLALHWANRPSAAGRGAIPSRTTAGAEATLLHWVDAARGSAWITCEGPSGELAWTAPARDLASRFGVSAAPVPDIDGDDAEDWAVASPGARLSTECSVELFSGRSGAELGRLAVEGLDLAGISLLGLPDVDGDGRGDVAVGVPNAATAGTMSGALLVYSGATAEPLWRHDAPEAYLALGASLVLVDDVDGDGIGDLACGAPRTYHAGERGAVSVLSSRTGELLWRCTAPGDLRGFGASIAPFADIDGDGRRELAVLAPPPTHRAGIPGALTLLSGADGAPLGASIDTGFAPRIWSVDANGEPAVVLLDRTRRALAEGRVTTVDGAGVSRARGWALELLGTVRTKAGVTAWAQRARGLEVLER